MTLPLSYDISVIGTDKIRAALRSVEQGVRAHNARLQGEIGRNTTIRNRTALTEEQSAKARVKAEAQAAREKARAQAAEDRARARTKSDQQRTRREAATSAMHTQNRAVLEERAANRTVEARRRAEVLAQVADRRRLRATEELDRFRKRAAVGDEIRSIRADEDKKRRARQIVTAEERSKARVDRLLTGAKLAGESRYNKLAGRAELMTRGARGVGTAVMGTIAVGGGALLATGLASEIESSAKASQLANQAGDPSMKKRILDTTRRVRGFTAMEAMGGLGSFMDLTGDAQTGLSILTELGDVALATSTDLSELGSAAGNAFIPLKDAIKDPEERLAAMRGIIRSMAGMGAVGAVEIKDLASEMAGLSAQATKFEGGPQRAMTIAMAMAQTSRQRGGSSSAPEAVTSVERFGSDILNKQADLRAIGVEVFANKQRTQMRSQDAIVMDVLEKTGGDLGKIGSIFGERSIRAIQGFSPLYVAAEQEAEKRRKAGDKSAPKKGQAGRAAVQSEFDRLVKASLDDKAVRERAASRMTDTDMQFKEAMKGLNAAVGREMLPAITKLIPELAKMAPTVAAAAKVLADFVAWAGANPWKGLGAIVLAATAKDIAAAGVGAALRSLITGLFAKQAAAAAVASVAGGGVGAVGTAAGGGVAGRVGAGVLGGSAALGVAGAGAAAGVGAAAWQAGELGKDVGMDWGWSDYINPLSWGQALGTGMASGSVADRDVAREELAAAARDLQQLRERALRGSEQPTPSIQELAPSDVAGSVPGAVQQQAGAPTTPAQVDASKLNEAADALTRAAQEQTRAAQQMGSGLNRGNTPSPIKG